MYSTEGKSIENLGIGDNNWINKTIPSKAINHAYYMKRKSTS